MAVFEKTKDETSLIFPTEPAYLIPVEIRDTPQYGLNHKGVFALTDLEPGTKTWAWTNRVEKIHHDTLESYIHDHFHDDTEKVRLFLRQGFVLPNDDEYFCSNPTDAGRFTNHSNDPNSGPDGILRKVKAGEEITMDYAFHGNPVWYQEICAKYGVLTEAEIAARAKDGEVKK